MVCFSPYAAGKKYALLFHLQGMAVRV